MQHIPLWATTQKGDSDLWKKTKPPLLLFTILLTTTWRPAVKLHIGSAKAICINSDAAKKYGGLFNLRFDDTNPVKEDDEFVRSIEEDLRWLGAEPNGGIYYGSDYFDQCYEFAVQLIRDGKAFVCDLTPEQMKEYSRVRKAHTKTAV